MKLPLFPLDTVLFPGCLLDLQLFEARYLDMLSGCMKRGEGFGVVTLLEGAEVGAAASSFSAIGCEALIRDWQQQANGLLGIRVEGGRRFMVEDAEVQRDQLTVGQAHWLDEGADAPLGEAHAELVGLLQALGEHPLVQALDMGAAPGGCRELTNRLAYLLPLSHAKKLNLLECDDLDERLHRLQAWLEELQREA